MYAVQAHRHSAHVQAEHTIPPQANLALAEEFGTAWPPAGRSGQLKRPAQLLTRTPCSIGSCKPLPGSLTASVLVLSCLAETALMQKVQARPLLLLMQPRQHSKMAMLKNVMPCSSRTFTQNSLLYINREQLHAFRRRLNLQSTLSMLMQCGTHPLAVFM